jgi:uncharacterized SAM-binding protein YcdF (DUF218 family)
MEFGLLKPILTALILPPTIFLIGAAFGLVLVLNPRIKNKRPGVWIIMVSLSLIWFLSCQGFAMALSQILLRQYQPVTPEALVQGKVQAVMVLGGGVTPVQIEYGEVQAQPGARERLRYGAYLANKYQLPMAFSGGIGWAADAKSSLPEGDVANRIAAREYGTPIRWVESSSRDTRQNAQRSMELLSHDGINRIALVTHAWHMPRAERAFKEAGFQVTPAPMGYIDSSQRFILNWLPSIEGLRNSTVVMRESLGLIFT